MLNHNQKIGARGEDEAVAYLRQNGYNIVERNWRVGRLEVDIIVTKGELLIFVEVKSRTSDFFGLPEEAVDEKKLMKIIDAADEYVHLKDYDGGIQFDVISVLLTDKIKIYHVEDVYI